MNKTVHMQTRVLNMKRVHILEFSMYEKGPQFDIFTQLRSILWNFKNTTILICIKNNVQILHIKNIGGHLFDMSTYS